MRVALALHIPPFEAARLFWREVVLIASLWRMDADRQAQAQGRSGNLMQADAGSIAAAMGAKRHGD